MTLKIETFSSLKGGNSYFKALTHPDAAPRAAALVERLRAARSVAIVDPQGFLAGFATCWDLSSVEIEGVYVQAVAELGDTRLGHCVRPLGDLSGAKADLVLLALFDAERTASQLRHLLPSGAELVTLDAMRLDEGQLTNRRHYLDPLNFATNFAFFRDRDGSHTRLVTANYWSGYGAASPALDLVLFDQTGSVLARWREAVGPEGATITIDSRAVRRRFELPEFEGQLFVHVIGAAGHDVVKYALDTLEADGPSLSCTHDANAWPADFYAGLPAPRAEERVVLWIQNSLPVPIPAGEIRLNPMGDDGGAAALAETVPPFASVALDVATLLPEARWPQQIEIAAGRYIVRPRYEVIRGERRRIAHPNVERIDLKPAPELARLAPFLGKGFILPAPILPRERWRSLLLPTPMARSQQVLPIAAVAYDEAGRELGRYHFGRLARHESVALELDEIAGGLDGFGHVELVYDFAAGDEADGWLHALFRYEDRASGHAAETSFGSHVFNTVMTWRDEPQSYTGKPPGLSTRLFLRLGEAGHDTLCHLVYPASTPWHARSSTQLVLLDRLGTEVARHHVEIACGGSLFWRYSAAFEAAERAKAEGGSLIVRDQTCRLFGYHGLEAAGGKFSLDHMFGF
jgi:hypothetical protein